jgi:hypothetical protein
MVKRIHLIPRLLIVLIVVAAAGRASDFEQLIAELGHAESAVRRAAIDKARQLDDETRDRLVRELHASSDSELRFASRLLGVFARPGFLAMIEKNPAAVIALIKKRFFDSETVRTERLGVASLRSIRW